MAKKMFWVAGFLVGRSCYSKPTIFYEWPTSELIGEKEELNSHYMFTL